MIAALSIGKAFEVGDRVRGVSQSGTPHEGVISSVHSTHYFLDSKRSKMIVRDSAERVEETTDGLIDIVPSSSEYLGLETFVERLAPEQQQVFQSLDSEFQVLKRRTAQQMRRMGEIAQEMRAILPDGPYGIWLAQFGFSPKSINSWVHVADKFTDSEVQNFVPTAAALLAQPSLPEAAREEARAIADAGQIVDMATAREIRDRHKPDERYESLRIRYQEAGWADLAKTGQKKFKLQAVTTGKTILFRGLDEAEDNLPWAAEELKKIQSFYATSADSTAMPPAAFVPSLEPAPAPTNAPTAAATPTGYVTSANPNPFAESIPAKLAPREHTVAVATSSRTDWHLTPKELIVPILETFKGRIDLDVSSNSKETPNIPAEHHYTVEDDGLSQDWFGKIFGNPPYSVKVLDDEGNPIPLRDDMTGRIRIDRRGRMVYRTKSVIAAWTKKLIEQVHQGNVEAAQWLVKNDPSTEWFQALWQNAQAICFIDYRLAFQNDESEGNSAPFTSAVAYFGDDVTAFETEWRAFGVVVTQWSDRRSWDEVSSCLAPF